jgi:hypothetical protein
MEKFGFRKNILDPQQWKKLKKDNFMSAWIISGSASEQKSRSKIRNHQNILTQIRKDLPETHLLIDGDGTLPLLLPDSGEFHRRFPGLIRPRLRNRQPHLLRQVTLLTLE